MKKVQIFILMLILSSFTMAVYSQTPATWKEMEEFHAVMSSSFHPADEGNFKPLRENATDLLTKAKAWQKSAVPEGYNATMTKDVLKRLTKHCTIVKNAVNNNKTDADLKKLITEAHEIFHEIKEKCRTTETK